VTDSSTPSNIPLPLRPPSSPLQLSPSPLTHSSSPISFPLTPNSSRGTSPSGSFDRPHVSIPVSKFSSNGGGPVQNPTPLATPPSSPQTPKVFPSTSSFLSTLFPRNVVSAAPYTKSITIDSGDITWDGFTLELPGQPKTLYVSGKGAENVELRESIVALLELADEYLECSAFVIALDRQSPALEILLHSLMYVGGTVVSKPPFPADRAFVLVGIEI